MTPDEENKMLAQMFAASCVNQGRHAATYVFRAVDGFSIGLHKRLTVMFQLSDDYEPVTPDEAEFLKNAVEF